MSDYIEGKDVLKRWKMRKHEFYYRFVKKGLMPYNENDEYLTPSEVYTKIEDLDPNPVRGSHWNKVDLPGNEVEAEKILEKLEKARFHISQVEAIEKKFGLKRKRKLDPRQKARLKCREVAKRIWEEEQLEGKPITPTAQMIDHNGEIAEASMRPDGGMYSKKTVRKWIQDLNPKPKTGRPKK